MQLKCLLHFTIIFVIMKEMNEICDHSSQSYFYNLCVTIISLVDRVVAKGVTNFSPNL
jgi:hypothetical protein